MRRSPHLTIQLVAVLLSKSAEPAPLWDRSSFSSRRALDVLMRDHSDIFVFIDRGAEVHASLTDLGLKLASKWSRAAEQTKGFLAAGIEQAASGEHVPSFAERLAGWSVADPRRVRRGCDDVAAAGEPWVCQGRLIWARLGDVQVDAKVALLALHLGNIHTQRELAEAA